MTDPSRAYITMMEQQRGALCGLLNGAFGPHQWRIYDCQATGDFVVEAEQLDPRRGVEGGKFTFRAPPGPDCVKLLRTKMLLLGVK